MTLIDVVALGPWGSSFFDLAQQHTSVFEQLPAELHESLVRSYISGASTRDLQPDVLERLASPWLGERSQPASIVRSPNRGGLGGLVGPPPCEDTDGGVVEGDGLSCGLGLAAGLVDLVARRARLPQGAR